jgi:hypothetical protein
MANLLQSSQTQATTAPDYYTKYLSDIASQGANAATGAQYIGAQPLQQQAFENVGSASTAYQPTLEQAGQTLTSASGSASPLSSASPYLTKALSDPSQMAQGYMSPYIKSVINNISDIGQRNIQQNLAPQATSSAVGSGQFGSQRGAQVLGQVISGANQDINNQIGQLLNTGYNTALQTAQQQNQLAGQLGSTASTAESAGQQNLTQAGKAQSDLAAQNQALGLAGVNALSTLGGQQQTIAQNQQLFPLTNLATLSGLLRGYNVPTTTMTTATGSPLSGLATIGAGAAGLFQTPSGGQSLFQNLTGKSNISDWLKSFSTAPEKITPNVTPTGNLTPSGLSILPDPSSPSGYSDSDGNPVNANGQPYVDTTTDKTE